MLAFGPWVDAFRTGRVGQDESSLENLTPLWRAELSRLLPDVAIPGLPIPSDDSRRLFESVAQLLGALAATGPVVIILEDLHWADEMSLRLFAFLARRVAGVMPVLLLGTARDDELPSESMFAIVLDEIARERTVATLPLGPLSPTEMAALVRSLSRRDADEVGLAALSQEVWRLSEGNPFVAVALMQTGPTGTRLPSPGLSLPEQVHQLIRRRVERLSERARGLLAVAAVIGREFEFALAQQAAGCTEEQAAEIVEELVRRHVLHGVGEKFDFTHERIREVVYAGLLGPRRILLHARVAQALEQRQAGSLEGSYAALGMHYRKGERWDKALRSLHLAAAQAMARSANRQAAACYEQALAALEHLPESRDRLAQGIDLRLELRDALFPLGEAERVLEWLGEAQTRADLLGDQRRQGWVAAYLANSFWASGDHAAALEAGRQAAAAGAALDDHRLQALADIRLGQANYALGEYERACEGLRSSTGILENTLRYDRFGLVGLPSVFSRALSTAREHRERGHEAWSLRLLGLIALAADDLSRAKTHLGDAHALSSKMGMRPLVAHCHSALGQLYRRLGEGDVAEQHFANATAMYREMMMRFSLETAPA